MKASLIFFFKFLENRGGVRPECRKCYTFFFFLMKAFHSTKNAKFLILCNIRISYFNQIKSNFTIILLKHKLNSEFFII